MPVSPSNSERLAEEVRRVYERAELRLLMMMASYLSRDLEAPNWAELKLLQLQLLQGQANRYLDHVSSEAVLKMTEAMAKAANRGKALAMSDLEKLLTAGAAGRPFQLPGLPAVEELLTDLLQLAEPTRRQVLRWVDDSFRQVIGQVSTDALLGAATRREVAESAFQELAARGISGFRDKAGRNWVLESYIEMATRTSLMRATTQAYEAGLQQAGHDLVIVSNSPQECKICRPWEGKVLSISGALPPDRVTIAGTVAEAKADGLFHPNCRHSISLFQPGVTKAPTRTADPDGDRARQQLRSLERRIRAERRKQLTDFDYAEAWEVDGKLPPANDRIRALQAQIRDLTASTSAKRQPHRERLGAL